MLNRVALRQDEFIIERRGGPMAALVPVARLEQVRRFARRRALEFMDAQRSGPLSDREAMDIALAAQRWARARARKLRPSAK